MLLSLRSICPRLVVTSLKAFAGTVVNALEFHMFSEVSPGRLAKSAGTMLLALYLLILRSTIGQAGCR